MIALTLIASILAVYLSYTLFTAYLTPLSRVPPAHVTTPFSRIWLLFHKYTTGENRARLAAHRRLGPVIRIGPRELSINCIDHGIRSIYGSMAFDKDPCYQWAFRAEINPYMFTMLSSSTHSERKRMLTASYSKSYIMKSNRLVKIYDEVVGRRFKRRLGLHVSTGDTIDALELSKACLMDIVTVWLYGLDVGTTFLTDTASAQHFFKAMQSSSAGVFWRSEFPHLTRFLFWLHVPILPDYVYRSQRFMEDWSKGMCAGARTVTMRKPWEVTDSEESADYPLTYTVLRRALERSKLQKNEIEPALASELLDHVVAGHDAPGITLTYLMYELSKNRALQHQLRAELRDSREKAGADLTARELDSLPLLDAVVLETLRVHSANPGPWPRVTSIPGIQVGPYPDIPAGTTISASSWTLHQNPDVYPCPEKWSPERWLGNGPDTRTEMMRWFWPFGSGAR